MKTVTTFLNDMTWLITIAFQIAIGFIAGYIFFAEGYGNILFMWVGVTITVFLIGLIAIFFRKAFNPKKYLLRLGLTALGVSFSLIYFYLFAFYYNADYEMFPQYPFLATVGGIIGFYVLNWLTKESSYWKTVRTMGYSTSALVVCTGIYVLWDWLTPSRLPTQDLRPNQAFNMELVNIVGDGTDDNAQSSFDFWDLDGGVYVDGTKGVLTTDEASLYIVDFLDPTSPVLTNLYDVGNYYSVIAIRGNYIYIHTIEELQILDISNPIKPVVIWRYNGIGQSGQYIGVSMKGDYAYLIDEVEGLYIYNIANPPTPRLIAYHRNFKDFGYINGFDTSGEYFYIFDDWNFYAFNSSNLQEIFEVDSLKTSTYQDVTIIENLAFMDDSFFIGNEPATLSIVDLSNPEQLKLVGSYHWLKGSNISGISEDRVYIADWSDGVHVMDFSNPKKPIEVGFFGMEDGAQGIEPGRENFIYVVPKYKHGLYVLRYIPKAP